MKKIILSITLAIAANRETNPALQEPSREAFYALHQVKMRL